MGQSAREWLDSVGVKIVATACQNTAVIVMVDEWDVASHTLQSWRTGKMGNIS